MLDAADVQVDAGRRHPVPLDAGIGQRGVVGGVQVAQVVPAGAGPLRHDVQLAAVPPRAVAQVQGDLRPAGRAGQRGHRVAGVVLRFRAEMRHLRQRHRQHVLGQRDRPGRVGLVVHDGERLAPVALPGEQPVLHVVRAAARADPVPLQALDPLRPVHLVQAGQQPLGVRGDAQHPLAQRPAVHRVVADRAAPLVGHLLVGQDGTQPRAPVDDLLRQVGQPVTVDDVPPLPRGQVPPRPPVRGGAAARGELGDQFFDRPGPSQGRPRGRTSCRRCAGRSTASSGSRTGRWSGSRGGDRGPGPGAAAGGA